MFDRPAGSERDLVVLAEAMGATVVQRHPNGTVRVVGDVRRAALGRADVAPRAADRGVDRLRRARAACTAIATSSRRCSSSPSTTSAPAASARSSCTGPTASPSPTFEVRLPDAAAARHPPARPTSRRCATPSRQIDGAAVFDADGILRQLGVRLVPSAEAETVVEGLRGMRHTSGRRYSFDDPAATVIVVSEDGPVTVLRNGESSALSR